MGRRGGLWVAAALALGAAACEGGGGGAAGPADAAGAADTAEAIPWTPGASTTKTPTWGACRYAAGEAVTSASNGAADDALALTGPAAGPLALAVTVSDGQGIVLDAALTVARGLPGKSFKQATGTASLRVGTLAEVTVLDGALCFEERLTAGAAVAGELSLVLEDAGGALWTVAGRFALPGAAVGSADPVSVDAAALDVDLR